MEEIKVFMKTFKNEKRRQIGFNAKANAGSLIWS